MSKGILNNRWFYCNHIESTLLDNKDIDSFSVRYSEHSAGLKAYIKEWAQADEEDHLLRDIRN